ncbi:SDR family oxidoreductase [Pollutimonas sp. H1-120]|uniref:SDR family oxidoreductase n=1 Tax=Pollutimonas sp. H1-120 TaxID=3148824 RepID=UPI003B520344
MIQTLENKRALVTAAGQGIGRAVALRYAQAGAQVFATDINTDLLDTLRHPAIKTLQLDVMSARGIQASVESIGKIDILFNCAGVVHDGTVMDIDDESLDFAFNLNVRAMLRMIQAYLPSMLDQKEGVIINMSSVASSVKGVPNRCAYSLTKAAVIGLTKSVAVDYIADGIRCNAICPATVDSPSLHERLHASGDYDAALRDFIDRQPLGRIGTPDEVADLALYLATATYTTGHAYLIDGGWAA